MGFWRSLFGNRSQSATASSGGVAFNVSGSYNQIHTGIPPEVLISLSKKLGVAENERDSWMQRYQELERQVAMRHDDIAQRAKVFLDKGDLDQAEALFEQAFQHDLKNTAANAFSLAQINDLRYQTPAALNYARRATELDADNLLYWVLFGNLQLRAGNLPQAERAFQ